MIWFVNPKTGNDANDGRTMATAFRSLPHAAAVAASGDSIVLAPGAYDQTLPQQVSAARAANVNVTVAGAD